MEGNITGFLDALGSKVFWMAVTAPAVINGAALGVPLVAALTKLGIGAVSALFGGGAAPHE